MQTNNYNAFLRDFAAAANTLNPRAYDYVRSGGHNGETAPSKARLPLDVIANDQGFVISAYVPGVNPENVNFRRQQAATKLTSLSSRNCTVGPLNAASPLPCRSTPMPSKRPMNMVCLPCACPRPKPCARSKSRS